MFAVGLFLYAFICMRISAAKSTKPKKIHVVNIAVITYFLLMEISLIVFLCRNYTVNTDEAIKKYDELYEIRDISRELPFYQQQVRTSRIVLCN